MVDRQVSLEWVHAELVRIEQHWTDQVQNQQRRIAAVLAVNGFLLGFLSAAAFLAPEPIGGSPRPLFVTSLALLAVALGVGVLELFPQIKIGQNQDELPQADSGQRWLRTRFFSLADPDVVGLPLWLDAGRVWESYRQVSSHSAAHSFLWPLCASVAANAHGNRDHWFAMARRRRLLHLQIAIVLIALGLLISALAIWATHAS